MKIGIYTDPHISINSSILPLYYYEGIYSTRLTMMIRTFKWMYKLFDNNDVELIINGGDTFDSHTLKAEEIKAASECFSYSSGIKEYHIIGNHDTLDNSRNYYATAILDGFPFITVCNQPIKINDTVSLIPYMHSDLIDTNMLKSIENKVLVSHIDIAGSHLRPDYIMDSGINPELLANYFEVTFNGHLHTREIIETSRNKVINVGSCTSNSFSDNNTYIPGVCIYDTDSDKIEYYNNPFAILFRRIDASSESELISKLDNMDNNYEYAIRLRVPYNVTNHAREIISGRSNIIAYRVISSVDKSFSMKKMNNTKIELKNNIAEEFINFLQEENESFTVKYPIDKYLEVLKNVH